MKTYLKEWNEFQDELTSPDVTVQIGGMCKAITKLGVKVAVATRNGRIYVYLNDNHSFDTNANTMGANTVLSYLSGVVYGLTLRK